MFSKGFHIPAFSKNVGGKLLGAAKGVASHLDNPIVAAVAPEVALGVAVAKKYGLLEKAK